jgi:anti-anti-sigma factor
MDVKATREGNAVVAQAAGRLDSNSATNFEEGLMKIVDSESSIILDMSELSYVSSAGLRVLLMAAKKCKATGRRLALCGLLPEVRMVFEVSGFLALFVIHASRAEAVAAFA